jgi:sulfite reductase (NADPH) flavoprotein alpha-component
MSSPLLPDNAPFSPAQRAWLNGFFAALVGTRAIDPEAVAAAIAQLAASPQALESLVGPAQAGEPPVVTAPEPAVAAPAPAVASSNVAAPPPAAPTPATTTVQAASQAAPHVSPSPTVAAAPTPAAIASSAQLVQDDEAEAADGDFPWHDPSLEMDERLALAEGRKPERVLMAAMAQLDCGSCGYLCQTYAEAIAAGADADLTKCSPGGRETTRKLRELVTTLRVGEMTVDVNSRPAERSDIAINTGFADGTYPARLLRTVRLTGSGSAKDVRHVELDLRGTALSYKVGDSLGVVPENCDSAVDEILDAMGATGAEDVPAKDGGGAGGHTTSFRQALQHERMITKLTADLVEFLADVATNPKDAGRLLNMLVDEPGLTLEGVELIVILRHHPSARPTPADLVANLPILRPRLYSISSSPLAHPGQVHLTVSVVRFENKHQRICKGVASSFLAERIRPGDKVRVLVHQSARFGLPADPSADIVMIGPGTGIAPFRAFLEERKHLNAAGRNWLFFGDQHEQTDFLYRNELLEMQSQGVLHQLETAFSRDTDRKIYVQHRMKEKATELWKWMESGASIYVCGDAKRMARDVDLALKQIVAEQGNMSKPDAANYVAKMSKDGRYLRDVY